ncbi:MAG: lpbca thioredoxin [Parcubacteria group bacterium GW2011_GWA2_44_12]|nr:MAG: lpbca thioredoxin [Parcubacteria group bacterium GW2011_GWA2_44_12]
MAQLLTEQNFDELVLKSHKPAFIEFFASWCGPCKMLSPIIDELAEEYKDKDVIVAKINVDDNNQIASKYGVMSIPTMLFFTRDGDIAHTMAGVQRKEKIREKIDELLVA